MDERDRKALTREIVEHERELKSLGAAFEAARDQYEARAELLRGMISAKSALLGLDTAEDPEEQPREEPKKRPGRPKKA